MAYIKFIDCQVPSDIRVLGFPERIVCSDDFPVSPSRRILMVELCTFLHIWKSSWVEYECFSLLGYFRERLRV